MRSIVNSTELALLAGVSPRAIKKALLLIQTGKWRTWRGAKLVIEQGRGRGGRAGWNYVIRVDSLPFDLQQRWREASGPLEAQLKHGADAGKTRNWRFTVIYPAVGKKGAEKAEAVHAIAAREHVGLNGLPKRVPERTLYRWLDAYERDGAAGLQRKARSDSRIDRTSVTQRWDEGVPLDDLIKDRIGERLRQYIRSLRAKGTRPSNVAMLAAGKLADWTREAGFDPGAELAALCAIPQHMIAAERHYEAANVLRTDAKTHSDERMRHRRTRDFAPMECVVGDVHPVDILCTRADGSKAHARLIAWQDLGTGRVWATVVLLDKGKGITNAHVIQSFIDMVEHWGMPRRLYLDNGSEYLCADFIDDALKLVDGQGHRLIHVDATGFNGQSGVKRTRPYAPQSKPIEGLFALLEQLFFRHIEGWIGGDRMASKSANLGKPPVPFGRPFADLQKLIQVAIDAYHVKPQGKASALKGRSPAETFNAAVKAGWRRTAIDPVTLRIAFSEKVVRDNRGGAVQVARREGGTEFWTCRELREHHKAKVYVLRPKFEDWRALPIFDYDDDRVLIGLAEPQERTAFFDPKGACLSDAYGADRRRGARRLGRSVPDVDVLDELQEHTRKQPAMKEAPIGAVVGASTHIGSVIEQLQQSGADKALQDVAARNRDEAAIIARQEARSATLAKIMANKAKQTSETGS